MTLKEKYDLICKDIEGRNKWAENQAVWYKLRGEGLPRKKKPFPGAADMHYPLADGTIDNWKPFYSMQLFATELMADFIGEPGVPPEAIQESAYWFDYKLKEKSNLEEALNFADDHSMVYGRGILKTLWDTKAEKLRFEAIEPLHLIVPANAVTLDEATRFTHVKHLSVWDYKNGLDSKKYNKSEEFIKSIKCGSDHTTEADPAFQAKQLARGITHSEEDIIILWEMWDKQPDGKWEISTISPMRPHVYVRAPYKCPYKLPDGTHPFTDFVIEARQGYYEARGICELLSQFEASLNKNWNEKLDAMTFYNRPLFSADNSNPNVGNIRFVPGQILPFRVTRLDTGAPAISWDQEMSNTRVIAQQRVSVPDFGVADQLYGGKKDAKTATEVDKISNQQQLMVSQRSRLYRRRLARLYRVAWALLVQYDDDMGFLREGKKLAVRDKKILESIVSIAPAGTSDSWDTHRRFQKATSRLAMWQGNPFVNQGELVKSVLELDEPGLVRRLFVDPREIQRNQSERQMIELVALEEGMPIGIAPDDDHAVHLETIIGRAGQKLQTGQPPKPQGVGPTGQHAAGHLQALEQQNPKLAKEFAQRFAQIAAAMQGGQEQPQQQPQ